MTSESDALAATARAQIASVPLDELNPADPQLFVDTCADSANCRYASMSDQKNLRADAESRRQEYGRNPRLLFTITVR
jgi:hypothetical protein